MCIASISSLSVESVVSTRRGRLDGLQWEPLQLENASTVCLACAGNARRLLSILVVRITSISSLSLPLCLAIVSYPRLWLKLQPDWGRHRPRWASREPEQMRASGMVTPRARSCVRRATVADGQHRRQVLSTASLYRSSRSLSATRDGRSRRAGAVGGVDCSSRGCARPTRTKRQSRLPALGRAPLALEVRTSIHTVCRMRVDLFSSRWFGMEGGLSGLRAAYPGGGTRRDGSDIFLT